jgi:hypothetical protein
VDRGEDREEGRSFVVAEVGEGKKQFAERWDAVERRFVPLQVSLSCLATR